MEKEKHIIFFLPDSLGGVAYFIKNLLEGNNKSNIHTKVILYRHTKETKQTIDFSYNANEQIRFVYNSKDNKYFVFKELKEFISSPKSIIVANDGLELSMINALKLPNPVFYIVHGDNNYYYHLTKLYHGIIDFAIPVSKYIEQNLTIKKSQTKLIYAPVQNIKPGKKKENHFRIVFVGNINESKGVYTLIKIIQSLSEKEIALDFTIIGSGVLLYYLKETLKNYDNVLITGQLSHKQVLEYYQQSDIILLPSYSEGLPLVIVEAMKAGVVPICNDIKSGIPEIIRHKETGFRVSENNVETYTKIIGDLYENRDKCIKIGNAAREFADTHFDLQKQSDKYFDAFLNRDNDKEQKEYQQLPVGGILNKPCLPNAFVKLIRSIIKHPKI